MDMVLLEHVHRATGVPLQLVCGEGSPLSLGAFWPNPAQSVVAEASASGHAVCYTITREFLCCGIVKCSAGETILVGPAHSVECSYLQTQRILTELGEPLSRTNELLRYLNALPIMEIQRFLGVLALLNHVLNGGEGIPLRVEPTVTTKEPAQAVEATFMEHFSDLLERELTSGVEGGKSDELRMLFTQLDERAGGFPMVAPDAVRSFKNICIFSAGVASRAAMKGGLDYDTANVMTSQYLERIERQSSYTDIYQLFQQMFLDYAGKVARSQKLTTTSPLARRIDRVVLAHLHERITPTAIAELLGMNCSYLCRHFKQNTNMTISEHINKTKITEAQRLLAASTLSIAQISELLGYSSQNYFHKIFRLQTGISPQCYRNANHK